VSQKAEFTDSTRTVDHLFCKEAQGHFESRNATARICDFSGARTFQSAALIPQLDTIK